MPNSPRRSLPGPCFSSAAALRGKAECGKSSGAFTGLEDQSEGSIVDQRDLHVRLEYPRFHGHSAAAGGFNEIFVQRAGGLGGRGGVEARTAPLAAVAVE